MALPRWMRVGSAVLAILLTAQLFQHGGDPDNAGLFPAPWDKVAHFCFYATIAGLLVLAFSLRRPSLVWVLVVGVGVLDEWVQRSEPWRTSDPLDLAVDALGALVAVTVYRRLVLWRNAPDVRDAVSRP